MFYFQWVSLYITGFVYTLFPRIIARALISYMVSKPRRLNETGHLFEARRLFLIACFEGTVDLWHSLIAAHLSGLRALPPGDLRPQQQWSSFMLREHLLRSSRVVFLHLTLQKTIIGWTSRSIRLTNWSLDAKFALKFRVHAVCEARPLRTLAFIWNPALISYWVVKPPAFIQIWHLIKEIWYIYIYHPKAKHQRI